MASGMRIETRLIARLLRNGFRSLVILGCVAVVLEMAPLPACGESPGARGVPKGEAASGGEPSVSGKRDPFKLPVDAPSRHVVTGKDIPASLPPGPRGLVISLLKVEGVVFDNAGHGMIAIVSQNNSGAYFLRKNEELYDGTVTGITAQAVYFKERVQDPRGGESFRTIVKQLKSTGEGQ